jgi:cytochrome c oxidase assembly protein Cox11
MHRDEARKNVRLGMLLFVTALIMLGLAFAWALIYNNFG